MKSSGVYSLPVAGLTASSTCAYSLYVIASAASMSPSSKPTMSNCWRHVVDRSRVDAALGHGRKDFPFVAEAPVADLLAGKVLRRGDVLVLEAHLQRARALVDLGDVDDVRAGLAAGECLRHPSDCEVGIAVGEHRLRDDVDGALEDRDVEALVLVEALVDGCEVPGELRLRDPLQLQLHRRRVPHSTAPRRVPRSLSQHRWPPVHRWRRVPQLCQQSRLGGDWRGSCRRTRVVATARGGDE